MTDIGFPYSGNVDYPTPQRHYIKNLKRILQDSNSNILREDTGFIFETVDFNSKQTVEDFIKPKSFLDGSEDEFCSLVPFCGFSPYSKRNVG
jgi:hypothetical protein